MVLFLIEFNIDLLPFSIICPPYSCLAGSEKIISLLDHDRDRRIDRNFSIWIFVTAAANAYSFSAYIWAAELVGDVGSVSRMNFSHMHVPTLQ